MASTRRKSTGTFSRRKAQRRKKKLSKCSDFRKQKHHPVKKKKRRNAGGLKRTAPVAAPELRTGCKGGGGGEELMLSYGWWYPMHCRKKGTWMLDTLFTGAARDGEARAPFLQVYHQSPLYQNWALDKGCHGSYYPHTAELNTDGPITQGMPGDGNAASPAILPGMGSTLVQGQLCMMHEPW